MNRSLSLKSLIFSLLFLSVLVLVFFIGLDKYLNRDSQTFSWDTPLTSLPFVQSLDLTNPDDESLVFDPILTLSGKTNPKSLVVITREADDAVVTADGDGSFSKQVKLAPGLNRIVVTTFDDSGNSKQIIRTVYYSEEKI